MSDKRVVVKWQLSKDGTAWLMKRGAKHLGVAWLGKEDTGWFQLGKNPDAKIHGPHLSLEDAMTAAENMAEEKGLLA